VESGETPEECLRRELREELAITARAVSFLTTLRHQYPGRPAVELHFFAVGSYAGELRNNVFAEIRWLAAQDLVALDFLAADRPIVEALARGAF
jgi:8-oxo-dGTP diphosphatase